MKLTSHDDIAEGFSTFILNIGPINLTEENGRPTTECHFKN